MWWLKTECLSAYVGPRCTRLRRWRWRPWGAAFIDEASWLTETAVEGASALASEVERRFQSLRSVTVFLSGAETRLSIVDALPGVKSRGDWHALATKVLVLDVGLSPQDWEVRCDVLRGHGKAVVAAVSRNLMEALQISGGRMAGVPASVQPWSLICLRQLARDHTELPGVTIAESGGAITGFVEHGAEIRIHARRCDEPARLWTERKRTELAAAHARVMHFHLIERQGHSDMAPSFGFLDLLQELPS